MVGMPGCSCSSHVTTSLCVPHRVPQLTHTCSYPHANTHTTTCCTLLCRWTG
jgi:hypothetical protein